MADVPAAAVRGERAQWLANAAPVAAQVEKWAVKRGSGVGGRGSVLIAAPQFPIPDSRFPIP